MLRDPDLLLQGVPLGQEGVLRAFQVMRPFSALSRLPGCLPGPLLRRCCSIPGLLQLLLSVPLLTGL